MLISSRQSPGDTSMTSGFCSVNTTLHLIPVLKRNETREEAIINLEMKWDSGMELVMENRLFKANPTDESWIKEP